MPTECEGDRANEPILMTIRYADGREEQYNVFAAVTAHGLIPGRTQDGTVVYEAEENFGTGVIARIPCPPVIHAAMLQTMSYLLTTHLESMDEETRASVLTSLKHLKKERSTTLFKEHGVEDVYRPEG